MSKEWPLEGYFECGGQGLLVTPDCLGQQFTSRTANYDLIIGLPQPGTDQRPNSLRPPLWTYGPLDEDEDEDEHGISWGVMLPETTMLVLAALFHAANLPVDDLWDDRNAYIWHCRFYTSLTASTDEEFDAAAGDFVNELEEWWTHFTSWVSILTRQDFVQLGGHTGGSIFTKNWEVQAWTTDADGERAEEKTLGYSKPDYAKKTALEPHDLQACATATGIQGAPPAEWLFIRDARSLLKFGQNRRAVIDAATAAELAMNTLIGQYHATVNTDEHVAKALEKRCKSLEGCADVLKTLRARVLSGGLQDGLITPRNHATHGGHSLTAEQAQKAVDMAVDIVEEAYPLASLLSTQ